MVVDLSQSPADAAAQSQQAGPGAPALPPAAAGLLQGRFRLAPEEALALAAAAGLEDEEALLGHLLGPASRLARPPISDFRVGAAGLGESGAVYLGVNLEFARLPLYHSVHAEQFLLVGCRWWVPAPPPCASARASGTTRALAAGQVAAAAAATALIPPPLSSLRSTPRTTASAGFAAWPCRRRPAATAASFTASWPAP